MADREKVIKALEICSQDVFGRMCIYCTYESDYNRHCHEILMGDAIDLLKEQPQIVLCKDCKYMYEDNQYMCGARGFCVNEDFFCADGEAKT